MCYSKQAPELTCAGPQVPVKCTEPRLGGTCPTPGHATCGKLLTRTRRITGANRDVRPGSGVRSQAEGTARTQRGLGPTRAWAGCRGALGRKGYRHGESGDLRGVVLLAGFQNQETLDGSWERGGAGRGPPDRPPVGSLFPGITSPGNVSPVFPSAMGHVPWKPQLPPPPRLPTPRWVRRGLRLNLTQGLMAPASTKPQTWAPAQFSTSAAPARFPSGLVDPECLPLAPTACSPGASLLV